MDEDFRYPLERQLVSIMRSNREGSYNTYHARFTALRGAAHVIIEKYGLQKWENLGKKHVDCVVETWKREDSGHRGIANKLSHLRWFLEKIGKPVLLPRTNAELGIEPGPRCTRAGKIITESELQTRLTKIDEERIRAMVLLGRQFGFRLREACLFRPNRDVDGNKVWVKRGSKGGRPRYLFIRTDRQREALAMARALVSGDGGLIPPDYATLEKWRQHVYHELRKAGFSKEADSVFHDLRRGYAVTRMDELIKKRGWCRQDAAKLVSKELGHNRTDILDWYINWEADQSNEADPLAA